MSDEDSARENSLRHYQIIDTAPEPNFDRMTRLAANIFGHPVCTLAFVDHDRFWFKSKHGVDATEMPRRLAFCAETISSDEVFVVPDARADSRFADAPVVAGPPRFRFYAGAPLITPSGSRIGSLCILDTEPQPGFSQANQTILRDLAATAVELLEARTRQLALAERNRQIGFIASHDSLTGLANRRRLQELLTEAGSDSHIALCYLDLDGFKEINDRHGHAVGDALLRKVADRMRSRLPAGAQVARLGGDEFAVLLRNDTELLRKAEQLAQDLIEGLGRPYQLGSHVAAIGVSIGIAILRGNCTLEAGLHAADAALYSAKRAGRGRYHLADTPLRPASAG